MGNEEQHIIAKKISHCLKVEPAMPFLELSVRTGVPTTVLYEVVGNMQNKGQLKLVGQDIGSQSVTATSKLLMEGL